MFDRKAGNMGKRERAIEAEMARFRAQLDALSGPLPEPVASDPLWQRAAAGIGGFLLYLVGMILVATILGGLAAAARFGWEAIG
ncbi:hypothetical protein ACIO8H_35735 [Streptomyces sp. NPDC087226]|uniref:hypothetical protein n=1 Tax=Streptomyces sp. NPDC087226 TaxID=3365771 RepID=UPI0037F6E031